MSALTLDTSGHVLTLAGSETALNYYTWDRLPNDFVRGYIEALLRDLNSTRLGEAIAYHLSDPEPLGFSDLSTEALDMILRDCEAYCTKYLTRSTQQGEYLWRHRQSTQRFVDRAGNNAFPPYLITLNDKGLIVLAVAS